jgi:non-specific serine/threonine protein kinase
VSRTTRTGTQIDLAEVPNNLPHDLSTFVGRDAERAEGARLLAGTRLLTLTGPGGAGKTRLAQRIAADARSDFAHGVWLVELAPVTDSALVADTVGQAIGVRAEPGRPVLDVLSDAIGEGAVLLVLDNCEHVLDGCAQAVEQLLRSCGALRVLATSREPLDVVGEVTWPVPPLSLPRDAADQSEAVALFVERATGVQPSFMLSDANVEAVGEICRRLDGLPLAIELAAARVRTHTPAEINARLDDRFRLLVGGTRTASPRQQTLAGALDWSYDLLSAEEQQLFAELAVFSGGFSLDAVACVCGSPSDLLLTRLVDRSLVVAQPDESGQQTRFHLLETVRVYALERLADRYDALRQRHAEWILEQAQSAQASFRGPEQGLWLRWAEREHDNIRAALAWLIERGDADRGLAVVAALWWSWALHLRWREGRTWCERALGLPGGQTPSRSRVLALLGAAVFASFLGDFAAAHAYFDRSEELAVALGDEILVMEPRGSRMLLLQLGGHREGLRAQAEELLAFARRIGHTWGAMRSLESLAGLAYASGEFAEAAQRLAEAERVARETGDTWNLARLLETFGDVERSRGEYAHAAALYAESRTLFGELGLGPYPSVVHNLGYIALAAGDHARAFASFGEALAQFRRTGDRRGAAECVIGFGCVLSARGDAFLAIQCFAAGSSALERLESQLWPSNRADYERWLAVARARVVEGVFESAWTAGSAWTIEEAVRFVHDLPAPPARSAGLLTSRELEVARLVAQGKTNRQVADALVVTEKTAANHTQRVLDKLGIHSRAQLAARAVEFELFLNQ